jgi:hypothetical protein
MSELLIKRILANREGRVELEPGKFVTVRRHSEAQLYAFRKAAGIDSYAATIDAVREQVVGWEGFREDDFLPAALASDAPVEFDAKLWGVVVEDKSEWIGKIAEWLIDEMNKHLAKNQEIEKN